MSDGLWLANGQWMSFAEGGRSALLTETATLEAVGLRSMAFLDQLPDPDPILLERGDNVEVLRRVRSDDKVITAIQTRKLGTLGKQDYLFEPGQTSRDEQPTPEAERLCRDLEQDLENVDLYNVLSQLLDAPYFGLAVAELIWEPGNGRLKLADVRPRPVEWFAFDTRERPLLKTLTNPSGELLHPYKFVFARHFPEALNPYGLRLLSHCLWPVAFKRGGIKFWLTFAERFGMPWTIGKVRPNASDAEKKTVRDALAAMVQDAVAVVTQGTDLTHMEVKGSGDVHHRLVEAMNAAVAQVLMGQTLTAQVGDTGSYAAANSHYQVLEDYRQADEQLVVAAMNELAWTYARVNAGPDTAAPVFVYREPEDYAARVDLASKLRANGVRFRKTWWAREFNLDEEDFDMAGSAPIPSEGQAFAEAAPAQDRTGLLQAQEGLDAMIGIEVGKAKAASATMSKELSRLLAGAESFEAMQALLASWVREHGGDMAGLLEQALLAADMAGRFAARREAE